MRSPIVAVGAIVTDEDHLLMVRRAGEPAAGLWSVPGGHVEHGEYLSDAVRREVKEETGLDVEVGHLIGIFEVVGTDDHFVILDYAARVVGPKVPVAGSDVADVRWVAFEEIADLECTPRFVETLKGWGVLK